MTHYRWRGVDPSGNLLEGQIQLKNAGEIQAYFSEQNITLLQYRKKRSFSFVFNQKISKKLKVAWIEQLADLLAAKIPLYEAMVFLQKQTTHSLLREKFQFIAEQLQTGQSFAEILKKLPGFISPIFCQLIHVGEQTGALSQLLTDIYQQQQKRLEYKRKFIHRLIYPSCIFILSFLITLLLLIFAMPSIENLYASFHATLPAYTLWVLDFIHAMIKKGPFIGLILWIFYLIIVVIYQKNKTFRLMVDQYLFSFSINRSLQLVQLFSLFNLLSNAKISTLESLTLAKNSSNNHYLNAHIQQFLLNITKGYDLGKSIENSKILPGYYADLIYIGEKTNQLGHSFARITHLLEKNLTEQLELLSKLAEPVMMMVLALIIGAVILALYLPIFTLSTLF